MVPSYSTLMIFSEMVTGYSILKIFSDMVPCYSMLTIFSEMVTSYPMLMIFSGMVTSYYSLIIFSASLRLWFSVRWSPAIPWMFSEVFAMNQSIQKEKNKWWCRSVVNICDICLGKVDERTKTPNKAVVASVWFSDLFAPLHVSGLMVPRRPSYWILIKQPSWSKVKRDTKMEEILNSPPHEIGFRQIVPLLTFVWRYLGRIGEGNVLPLVVKSYCGEDWKKKNVTLVWHSDFICTIWYLGWWFPGIPIM